MDGKQIWTFGFGFILGAVVTLVIVFIFNFIKQREASKNPDNGQISNKPGKIPRGLNNLGSTCYFNSVMQPLCHTHAFHAELCLLQKTCLKTSFIDLYTKILRAGARPLDPENVRNQFIKRVDRFDNHRQHDSHECLRHFLDEIRKEERTANDSNSGVSLTSVDKIFGGHLVTVYICKECDKHYHLFEPCLDISLPVFFEAEKERPENDTKDEVRIESNAGSTPKTSIEPEPKINVPTHDICSVVSSKDEESDDEHLIHFEDCDENNSKTISPKINSNEITIYNDTERGHDCEKHNDEREQKIQESEQRREDNEIEYKEAISKLTTRLSSIEENITIHDCLQHFSRVEQIHEEYLCEDCLRVAMAKGEADEDHLKLTSATKQTLIFNPPAVLTVHFKRFELLPGESRKRSDMVEYPEYLDIAPYCSSQCLRNDPPRSNIWYSLYAVVVHSGSLESGHYWAYVKTREREENTEKLKKFLQQEYFNHNVTSDEVIQMIGMKNQDKGTFGELPDGKESKWYQVNDSSVREAKLEEVLKQEAYLVFYERIDTAASSNFGTRLEDDTGDEAYSLCVDNRTEDTQPLIGPCE